MTAHIPEAIDNRALTSDRAVAWLIEMIHNDAPMPRYWNHSKFKGGWVWDANEAMRFCREQDARDFLDGLAMPLQGKPVEHVFIGLGIAAVPPIPVDAIRETATEILVWAKSGANDGPHADEAYRTCVHIAAALSQFAGRLEARP